MSSTTAQAAGASAAAQIADLKEQLNRVQQSIAALEATLQEAEQEKPRSQGSSQPQSEKPPTEPQQK